MSDRNEELQLELNDLEARLARRGLPAVSPGLKARVQASVHRALAREHWSFAAWVAAAAALVLNMALSGARAGAEGTAPLPDLVATERIVQSIRAAAPEIPEREALREALLVVAAARIPPMLVPPRPFTSSSPKKTALIEGE